MQYRALGFVNPLPHPHKSCKINISTHNVQLTKITKKMYMQIIFTLRYMNYYEINVAFRRRSSDQTRVQHTCNHKHTYRTMKHEIY